MSLVETFCSVYNFCQLFEPHWEQMQLQSGFRQRRRKPQLSLSEVMTIVIHFHQSGYRTFKSYYQILSKGFFGKLFADRGYISQDLFAKLFQEDLQLITGIRKNMQNRLMPWVDKLLLRKRSIIETINDQLKNNSQIEHSRHRSFVNFFANLIAGLIADCLQPKKPSLHIHDALPAAIH